MISGFLLLLCSCKKSNWVTVKDDQGQLSEKYQVNEAQQKHGIYESYLSGVLLERADYNNGKLNGKREMFYPNGNVEINENYLNDQLTGTYKSYFEDGTLSQEANYLNGMMEGLIKTYYPDGSLKEEVMMIANNENGPFKEYHKNGQVKWEGQYLNGDNEFGELKEYNEAGELIKKMTCDSMARCTTTWTIEKGEIKTDKS